MDKGCDSASGRSGNDSNLKLISLECGSKKGLGIRLSKSSWDPYPFVSNVENESTATKAGLQVGDCILKVNFSHLENTHVGSTHNKNISQRTRKLKHKSSKQLSRLTDMIAWEGRYKTLRSRSTIKQMMTTMESIYCYGARRTYK